MNMVKIIESKNDFGSMNSGSIRFSNLTDEDKEKLCNQLHIEIKDLELYDLTSFRGEIFLNHRMKMGENMGFDGRRMFMADQVHKDGSFFEINSDYVEANPKGWTDIPEDILVVTSKTPGVVIGHPVADCPVVMMTDKKQKISAIGHCSGELIDHRLPAMIGEVLTIGYGSRARDIYAYVSACAGDSWTYDCFPKWAKDQKMWDKCIIYGDDGLFHINMRPAVLMQIISLGIPPRNIRFNMDDTIQDASYYSNSASSKNGLNQEEKYGRHFAGLFFDGEDDDTLEIQKGRRR